MNIYQQGVFDSNKKNNTMNFKEYLNNDSGKKNPPVYDQIGFSRYEEMQSVRENVMFMNQKLTEIFANDPKLEIQDMFDTEQNKVVSNLEVYVRLIEHIQNKQRKLMKQSEEYQQLKNTNIRLDQREEQLVKKIDRLEKSNKRYEEQVAKIKKDKEDSEVRFKVELDQANKNWKMMESKVRQMQNEKQKMEVELNKRNEHFNKEDHKVTVVLGSVDGQVEFQQNKQIVNSLQNQKMIFENQQYQQQQYSQEYQKILKNINEKVIMVLQQENEYLKQSLIQMMNKIQTITETLDYIVLQKQDLLRDHGKMENGELDDGWNDEYNEFKKSVESIRDIQVQSKKFMQMPDCKEGVRMVSEDGVRKFTQVQERFQVVNKYLQQRISGIFSNRIESDVETYLKQLKVDTDQKGELDVYTELDSLFSIQNQTTNILQCRLHKNSQREQDQNKQISRIMKLIQDNNRMIQEESIQMQCYQSFIDDNYNQIQQL